MCKWHKISLFDNKITKLLKWNHNTPLVRILIGIISLQNNLATYINTLIKVLMFFDLVILIWGIYCQYSIEMQFKFYAQRC